MADLCDMCHARPARHEWPTRLGLERICSTCYIELGVNFTDGQAHQAWISTEVKRDIELDKRLRKRP